MPIEFRCPECQKLLRVGDDAAGKQAKCPGCGTPVNVPNATAPPLPPVGDSPFGPPPSDPYGMPPLPPPLPAGDNPYASPSLGAGGGGYIPSRGSQGPAWERDGASISSLAQTVRDCFSSPTHFFTDMRREGGIGQPVLFYFILNLAGLIVGSVTSIAFQGAMGGMLPRQQPGMGMAPFAAMAGDTVVSFFGGLVAIVIWYFVMSLLLHGTLMLFGGAKESLETTMRVVAYAGSTAALGLIPICGGSFQGIANLVFVGIGLCYAHRTDGWRAALAIISIIVCCFGAIAGFAVLFLGTIAAAGGAQGAPGAPPQPFDFDQFKIEELNPLPTPQASMPASDLQALQPDPLQLLEVPPRRTWMDVA